LHPIIQIKNLSISFSAGNQLLPAVQDINFSVNRGETVALVGESGSGKSITAISILRLLPKRSSITAGAEILFSETGDSTMDLLKEPFQTIRSIRGNQLAMIFQEPMTSLNPVFTCGNQVAESIRIHRGLSGREAKSHTIEWFNRVQLPDPEIIYSRFPHQLSGGQKQRVMIAMAMSCQPSLLICDEPTTALDVTVQRNILQLIGNLKSEEGMGVIFITHDLGIVAEIADRALVMYKGRIVESGGTRELFSNPQHPYTRGLLDCRPVLHRKGERLPVVSDFVSRANQGVLTERGQLKLSAARPIVEPENTALKEIKQGNDQPLLKVEHLHVWYKYGKRVPGGQHNYRKAVNDVSFEVYKGEILGLVGESGCGKSTLGRCLVGLLEPRSGKILFNGIELFGDKKKRSGHFPQDMQIVFQDPYSSLNPRIRIGSAIREPIRVHGLYSNDAELNHQVAHLLSKVDLKPAFESRYPHEFSGGQRQRIVIARGLSLQPSFVIFDESVSALDVSVQAQVLNLINDLKKELGFTVIFISHDLSVIRYISDRVLVMKDGIIVESGKTEEVYQRPKSPYTLELIQSIPKAI